MHIRPEDSALGFLVAFLRRARASRGRFGGVKITQAELAKKIGVSRVSIAHVESGRKSMSRFHFDKMCDQFDITCQGVKFSWKLHQIGDWAYVPIGASLIVTCRSTGNILLRGIVTRGSSGNFRLDSDVTGRSPGNNARAV